MRCVDGVWLVVGALINVTSSHFMFCTVLCFPMCLIGARLASVWCGMCCVGWRTVINYHSHNIELGNDKAWNNPVQTSLGYGGGGASDIMISELLWLEVPTWLISISMSSWGLMSLDGPHTHSLAILRHPTYDLLNITCFYIIIWTSSHERTRVMTDMKS